MKNLLSIFTVVCLSISMYANNSPVQSFKDSSTFNAAYFNDMNILSIKADINNNTRSYFMTGSFTVIKKPKGNSGVSHTVDVSFRNSSILSRQGSNYIQANAKATRNDNNTINEFLIYVNHDNGSEGKIDKRNIKVNWKTGSLEVVDKLANVSVVYQEDSILIIGTMQKNGYTIGVSLAIAKEARII